MCAILTGVSDIEVIEDVQVIKDVQVIQGNSTTSVAIPIDRGYALGEREGRLQSAERAVPTHRTLRRHTILLSA